MAGETYDSVPLRVERFDDEGVYKVGIVLDNAFVTIAAVKTGTVDELVERERVKAEDKSRADAAQAQEAERQRQQDEYERQRRAAEQPPQTEHERPAQSAQPPPATQPLPHQPRTTTE